MFPLRHETKEVLKGVGMALLVVPVHSVAAGILTGFAQMAGLTRALGAISLVVWIGYFLVTYMILRDRGRRGMVRGLLIGLTLIILLMVLPIGLFPLLGW